MFMRRCAICGGKAEVITSEDIITNRFVTGYKVICSAIGCGNATDWYGSEAQAISIWQDANKKTAKIN